MPIKGTRSGKYVVCPVCSKQSYRHPSSIKRGYKDYCSKKCWYEIMKGEGNPRFGKHCTEETKEKLREKRKTFRHTEDSKKKLSIASRKNARFGEKNNWWKGGIASERNRLGNSREWADWRKAVYGRDEYKCKKCGTEGDKKNGLNPHHIVNFAQCVELRFELNNGITLCQKCHRQFHGKYGVKNNTVNQIKEYLTI